MPDPGNHPIAEQHGEVSGLAAGGQRACGGPAGEEQLARMAANRVGVEIRQQSYTMRRRERRRAVHDCLPCKGAFDLNVLEFTGQGVEQLRRPPLRCAEPPCELLRCRWPVRVEIPPYDVGESDLSISRPESGQPPAGVGIGDFGAPVGAETERPGAPQYPWLDATGATCH